MKIPLEFEVDSMIGRWLQYFANVENLIQQTAGWFALDLLIQENTETVNIKMLLLQTCFCRNMSTRLLN